MRQSGPYPSASSRAAATHTALPLRSSVGSRSAARSSSRIDSYSASSLGIHGNAPPRGSQYGFAVRPATYDVAICWPRPGWCTSCTPSSSVKRSESRTRETVLVGEHRGERERETNAGAKRRRGGGSAARRERRMGWTVRAFEGGGGARARDGARNVDDVADASRWAPPRPRGAREARGGGAAGIRSPRADEKHRVRGFGWAPGAVLRRGAHAEGGERAREGTRRGGRSRSASRAGARARPAPGSARPREETRRGAARGRGGRRREREDPRDESGALGSGRARGLGRASRARLRSRTSARMPRGRRHRAVRARMRGGDARAGDERIR